jgi:CRP-like cAMP-binding protein
VKTHPFPFETLEPSDWDSLKANSQVFPNGHVFFREGESSRGIEHSIFGICSGSVAISSSGAGGRVPIVRTLGPGEFFGLVGFLATEQHTATCQAAGETSVVVLSADVLKKLQSSNPSAHTRLLWGCASQLAKDLRACNQRLLAAMDKLHAA